MLMKDFTKFLFFEVTIFFVIGLITLIEITRLSLFQSFFAYIKTPVSWFIGLSIAYVFSNFFQKFIFSFFRKGYQEGEIKNDFFGGFIVTLIITSLITPYLRQWILNFFGIFSQYFHVIIVQSVIILYLMFKVKERHEISMKHFLTNEIIILIYTLIILYFVA